MLLSLLQLPVRIIFLLALLTLLDSICPVGSIQNTVSSSVLCGLFAAWFLLSDMKVLKEMKRASARA
jgi:hypothetical protein